MATVTTPRSVNRFDTVVTVPHRLDDGLRLGARVTALRERLEARASAREAALLRTDVREAREFVRGFNVKNISANTAMRYDRLVMQMRATDQRPEDAKCKNTFEFRRAALVHVTRSDVKTALRDLDKYRRIGDVGLAANAYNRVRTGLETLRRYPPSTGSREADLARHSVFGGPSRADPERSNGKRASLSDLPDGWRDMVQREVRTVDRAAVAVMALTGCRPSEVRGMRVKQNGTSVSLIIRGAKVDDDRGVESRIMSFDREALARTQTGRDLAEWIGNREQRTISYGGAVEAFRERVSRAADRAGLSQVSAYTYRHAAARELKDGGMSRDEIATRLGHRSERSQTVYG